MGIVTLKHLWPKKEKICIYPYIQTHIYTYIHTYLYGKKILMVYVNKGEKSGK